MADEAAEARAFWDGLSSRTKWELGDMLVFRELDWRDWFDQQPSRAFMDALDAARLQWESCA